MEQSDPVLGAYLSEIANYPVMKAAEERELASTVIDRELALWSELLSEAEPRQHILKVLSPLFETARSADGTDEFFATVRKLQRTGSLLSRQEFATLARLFDTDREWMMAAIRASNEYPEPEYSQRVRRAHRKMTEAKNRFAVANLRLVVSVATRYKRVPGVDLSDLIQDGNIGLIKAIEKYDPEKGFRFSTYATWWIRHGISRCIADKSRAVRIPVHLADAHAQVRRFRNKWFSQHGQDPSPESISKGTSLDFPKVLRVLALDTGPALSLNAEINGGDEGTMSTWLDNLEGAVEVPGEAFADEQWKRKVEELLKRLNPTESSILKWRFGLDGQDELTLEEVGKKYNLTRERIRQLQEQALGKIRKFVDASAYV